MTFKLYQDMVRLHQHAKRMCQWSLVQKLFTWTTDTHTPDRCSTRTTKVVGNRNRFLQRYKSRANQRRFVACEFCLIRYMRQCSVCGLLLRSANVYVSIKGYSHRMGKLQAFVCAGDAEFASHRKQLSVPSAHLG